MCGLVELLDEEAMRRCVERCGTEDAEVEDESLGPLGFADRVRRDGVCGRVGLGRMTVVGCWGRVVGVENG